MTDKLKPMKALEKTREKIRKEIEKAQPIRLLPTIAEAVKHIEASLLQSRSAFARIEMGDFAERIRLENVEPDKVEDIDSFNAIVRSIAEAPTNEVRIKMCSKTLEAIKAAISRWQEKIDKMRGRSIANGCTQEEVAIGIEKIESFGYVIARLRERGEVISTAHDAARKAIEDFLANDRKNFHPMYTRG